MSTTPRFYHGGPIGRRLLSMIQPPSVTGVPLLWDRCEQLRSKMAQVYRNDRVYVTPDFNAALLFASLQPVSHVPVGAIYEVEPIGELEHDPDCLTKGLSFSCARARVLRIYPVPPSMQLRALRSLGVIDPEATVESMTVPSPMFT